MAVGAVLVSVMGCPRAGAAADWSVEHPPVPRTGHADLGSVSCPSPTVCVAVGIGLRSGSGTRSLLSERWNGHRWRIEPIAKPRNGTLNAVSCSSGSACTAVGTRGSKDGTIPLAERWDGNTWKRQPIIRGGGSLALEAVSCPTRRFCMAVGSTASSSLAVRWNGSRWAAVRTPKLTINGGFLTGVSCASRSACVAVGQTVDDNAEFCSAPLAERWNGIHWTLETTPDLGQCGVFDDATFSGVSCPSAVACTAVGYEDPANASFDMPLLESRTAGRWSISGGPDVRFRIDPWGGGGDLLGISCASASTCVAVGYLFASGASLPLIEHNNGSKWRVQPSRRRIADGGLLDVSCATKGVCMAVGFDDSHGQDTDVPLAERLS